jgi:hypothetical protein
MTTAQAAALLQLRAQTLAVWRLRRQGPSYVRVGRAIRYRAEDLQRFLDSRTVRNETPAADD